MLNGAGLGFEMLDGLERDGQVRGFDGRQQELGHRRINAIAADALAGFARKIFMELGTDVDRAPAIGHVAHRHTPATHATHHEALQQRPPFAGRPAPLRRVHRAIIIQLRQITMKLVPTDIARVMIA